MKGFCAQTFMKIPPAMSPCVQPPPGSLVSLFYYCSIINQFMGDCIKRGTRVACNSFAARGIIVNQPRPRPETSSADRANWIRNKILACAFWWTKNSGGRGVNIRSSFVAFRRASCSAKTVLITVVHRPVAHTQARV